MPKQTADPRSHDKPCTLCQTPCPVLVRCQVDESNRWHFICPGKCWNSVSGGEIDAKGHEAAHPFYRYGGMWKNRHADGPLHARKPKKKKKQQEGKENRDGETYDSDVSGGSQRDSDLLVARGVRRLGVEG